MRKDRSLILKSAWKAGLALFTVALLLGGRAVWADTTTFNTTVVGTAGPWSPVVNSSFPYSIHDQSPADAISAANGISFAPGGIITLTYLNGLVSAGPGFYPFVDADGDTVINFFTSFCYDGNLGSSGTNCPSFYMDHSTYPIYLVELVGTFADSGVIVGTPFKVGDGPTDLTIPAGANELLLGVNDDIFSDNVGSWTIQVSGPAGPIGPPPPNPFPTPEPGTLALFASGLLGLVAKLRRPRQGIVPRP